MVSAQSCKRTGGMWNVGYICCVCRNSDGNKMGGTRPA